METINMIREVLVFISLLDTAVVMTLVAAFLVLFFAALFIDDKEPKRDDQGRIYGY